MFANRIRSFKPTKNVLVAMMATVFLNEMAHANDDAIRVIFENSNIETVGTQQAEQKLPNGLRLSVSGGEADEISSIDKLTVTYPEGRHEYQKTINALRSLFGEPVSGRRDLLVWKVSNPNATVTQNAESVIIAGAHGQDPHVISLNRQGKARGNNFNSRRQVKKNAPAKSNRPKQKRSRRPTPNVF